MGNTELQIVEVREVLRECGFRFYRSFNDSCTLYRVYGNGKEVLILVEFQQPSGEVSGYDVYRQVTLKNDHVATIEAIRKRHEEERNNA